MLNKKKSLIFPKKISDSFDDESTTVPPLWENLDTNLIPEDLRQRPSDNSLEVDDDDEDGDDDDDDYYDHSRVYSR